MITITELSKTYAGSIQALNGINLEIGPGMFGLLGPNGAGKTTLMRIIAGLLTPDRGSVRVYGHRLEGHGKRAVQALLGYLPQDFRCYPQLSAREMLDYIAVLKGLADARHRRRQVNHVLELVRLQQHAEQPTRTFSGGMRRRLGIAQSLLGQPQLLIVDEPTVGLDPEERVHIRNLLAEKALQGIVLLSTHIVEDIGHTCNNLAIIKQGQISFQGSPASLADQARGLVWSIRTHGEVPAGDLRVISSLQLRDAALYRVLGQPSEQYMAEAVEPSLEDGYIQLVHATTRNNQPA